MFIYIGFIPQVEVCKVTLENKVRNIIHSMSAHLESVFFKLKRGLSLRIYIFGKSIVRET